MDEQVTPEEEKGTDGVVPATDPVVTGDDDAVVAPTGEEVVEGEIPVAKEGDEDGDDAEETK